MVRSNDVNSKTDFVIVGSILKEYIGKDECVVIPEEVEVIGENAFEYCEMSTVIIPEGVTKIGERAFIGCWNLKKIKIPKSVNEISEGVFLNCSNLMSVEILGNISYIKKDMFSGCKNLTELILFSRLEKIGESAFYNCAKLSIKLPENCIIEGDTTFCGCEKMVDRNGFLICENILYVYRGNSVEVVIPEEVEIIAENAFKDCSNIKSIVVPENVNCIESSAFEGCSKLEKINIPRGVKRIGGYAFHQCTRLNKVDLPEGIEYISSGLFRGCSSLESVIIPNEVGYIDYSAFESCTNLEQIVIPMGVITICPEAFRYCSNLKSVIIAESVVNFGRDAFACCNELENFSYTGEKGSITDEVFGNNLPHKLVDNIEELYKYFNNGAIKKYLLNKTIWEKMNVLLQCDIFMNYQAKGFISLYPKCITNAEDLGLVIYDKLCTLPSDKDCKAAANFMLMFYKNVSPQLLQQLYNVIKSVKTGKNAMNIISENTALTEKIQAIKCAVPKIEESNFEELSKRIVLLQNDLDYFLVSKKIDDISEPVRKLISTKMKSLQTTIDECLSILLK